MEGVADPRVFGPAYSEPLATVDVVANRPTGDMTTVRRLLLVVLVES